MARLLVFLFALVGCAGATRTTIAGRDLYANASTLREQGHAAVPTSAHTTIELRAEQYLIDRSRDQVFLVRDIVAGCFGHAMDEDAECTAALMQDQHFTISDQMPQAPNAPRAREGISGLNKARLLLVAAGVAMGVGAAKCELFDGCGSLLAIGVGLDALVLLVTFTGFH